MNIEESKLTEFAVEAVSVNDLTTIDGGWVDPYNMIHRNYPVAAGFMDFLSGIADGFGKGAAARA